MVLKSFKSLFCAGWRGEQPLFFVFWVPILLDAVICLPIALSLGEAYLLPVLLPYALLMTLWWCVAVWRCSGNTRIRFAGSIARVMVILNVLSMLLAGYRLVTGISGIEA